MEATKLRETQYEQNGNQPNLTFENVPSANGKLGRKLKRDSLNEKKRTKNLEREGRKVDMFCRGIQDIKSKQDEDHSATTQESQIKKDKIFASNLLEKNILSLNQLITKPPYMTLGTNSRIIGDLGHATAIFKRPIIEGTFYLEFTIKHEVRKEKKNQYKSAVRVGIVHHAYNPSFPIGCNESLAYKSVDGGIIVQGEKIDQKQSYGPGDVLGVCLKISSPKKHPNPQEINEDSTVSFYKNGKLILQYRQLKQIFYCFAVSLFNYGQVDVNMNQPSIYPMPEGAKHYFTSLTEHIPYSDLRENRIFKI